MLPRVTAVLFLCSVIPSATQYTCAPPPDTPLCQFPKKIDITFIGTATATNYDPNDASGWSHTWYRIQVEEALTGLRPDEKEIVAWTTLGSSTPAVGQHFFVHAERDSGRIVLMPCGNTKPVANATDDIAYLLSSGRGDFKPFISGSVLRHYQGSPYGVEQGLDGPPRGLPDVRVRLEGGSGALINLVTDAQGNFRANDVLPGSYTVNVDLPGYSVRKSYSIEVPPNGCGIAHVGMFTNSRISGVVRRADGTPASGMRLDLLDVDPHYAAISSILDKRFETGPNGEFSVSDLPAGRFLLGVNINESTRYPEQTPPTYYPSAVSRADAKVIGLAPNEELGGLVLTLPPSRPYRIVRVHLRWPDGTLPTKGAIDAWANRGIYVSNYVLVDGGFELKLLQGVDYWLTACAMDMKHLQQSFGPLSPLGTWIYTDNYRLPAGNDPVDITLTAYFPEPQWFRAVYSKQ